MFADLLGAACFTVLQERQTNMLSRIGQENNVYPVLACHYSAQYPFMNSTGPNYTNIAD